MASNKGKVQISLEVPDKTRRAINIIAAASGISQHSFVRAAVEAAVEECCDRDELIAAAVKLVNDTPIRVVPAGQSVN